MKNLLRTGLALAAALLGWQSATAQVTLPNAGLETWAVRNGADSPTNWQTTDDYLAAALAAQGVPVFLNVNAVQKSTTVHGGTYAAALVTQNVQALGQPLPGILIAGPRLGKRNIGGVPATTRPTQFEFYYQFNGPTSDSAVAVAYVTKTVNGQIQLLGVTYTYFQTAAGGSYTKATLPVVYDPAKSTLTPDTVRVLFYSGTSRTITPGTTLRVDDVALTGGPLATRADLDVQAQLAVAPNPSPGGRFVISSATQPTLAAAPLQVLDQLGRVVVRQPEQAVPDGQRELDLSALSPGLYLLRLDTRQGVVTRQLTVK